MTDASRRRFDKSAVLRFVALLTVGLLGLWGRAVAARDDGFRWIDILSTFCLIVVGSLLLTLLIFGIFDRRNQLRIRALSASHPGAFIGQVVVDPILVRQIDDFTVPLRGRRSEVRPNSYASLVADRSSIQIFSGSREPRLAASFPTSTLTSARLGSSQAGIRILPCLNLSFEKGGTGTTLNVLLFRTSHGVPRSIRGSALDAALDKFRLATGAPE